MSFSKSKQTQEVDNSTTTTTENKQVGASEGSVAIGAGSSNITIESVNEDVIGAAVNANSFVTDRALDSIDAVIDNNLSTTKAAFEFGSGVTRDALSEVGDTVEQANALLSQSFEQSANILARNAGVEGTDETSNSKTTLLIGGGLVALLILSTLKKSK